MKVVILAGGLGTRLSEETILRPKPMVDIGGKPILWHIMKSFSYFGFNDFIICCGYKGYLIKEYFYHYSIHNSDISINIKDNTVKIHQSLVEPWNVTLVDTGENTQTGGRIKKISKFIEQDDIFFMTYGDGLANINFNQLLDFHKEQKVFATVTAALAPSRFGALSINNENSRVTSFKEKPSSDQPLINAGFFVLSTNIFNYIENDESVWEKEPLEKIAKIGQLAAFKHKDFWLPMDTLRDKNALENLWISGKAPWKVWS